MNKQKLLELLGKAYDNAASKTGEALGQVEINDLYNELATGIDPTKVNQWIALNKDKLSMIPELAGEAAIIDISESPKVVQKDYGFTESDDFYKMEGPKSWMNKSTTYLRKNAEKYGMSLQDYLSAVAELSAAKERDRQWDENAKALEIKDVPLVGDISVPSLTSIMLPTSFNKARMGKEVTKGDIAYDVGTDLIEGGLATAPYGGPVYAALTGNAARQGKQLYDETQDKFHTGELAAAGAMGGLFNPIVFKTAGDVLKRVPGTQGIKQWNKAAKAIEDIGEVDPNVVLQNKVKELKTKTARYDAVKANEAAKAEDVAKQLFNELLPDEVPKYAPYNPTAVETKIYGKGSKLWRNVKTGEILTDKEYKAAVKFLQEAERGPDWAPGKNLPSNVYKRAVGIKSMPQGDILVNAWSEPRISKVLRRASTISGGAEMGNLGISMDEADKKALAKKIINSAEWGKYITGLPHNLSEEEIYLGTVYGE